MRWVWNLACGCALLADDPPVGEPHEYCPEHQMTSRVINHYAYRDEDLMEYRP